MTTDEKAFAGAIRRHLDQAAADLRPGIAYRLQQARARAIEQMRENTQAASGGSLVGARTLAGAGGGPDLPAGRQGSRRVLRLGLAIISVAAAAVAIQQWNAGRESEALDELDAQILTSELPIDAYLDRGFQQWLQASQPVR